MDRVKLMSVIEQLTALAMEPEAAKSPSKPAEQDLNISRNTERLMDLALDQTRGDISAAAKLLGIDRGTLSHWVNHGLKKKYRRVEAK